MIFSKIIGDIVLNYFPEYKKRALPYSVMDPKKTHIYGPGAALRDFSLTKPSPLELSVTTGVGVSGCPIYWSANHRAAPN